MRGPSACTNCYWALTELGVTGALLRTRPDLPRYDPDLQVHTVQRGVQVSQCTLGSVPPGTNWCLALQRDWLTSGTATARLFLTHVGQLPAHCGHLRAIATTTNANMAEG